MAEKGILESVKKVLGLDKEYDVFDLDIIMHINSVFSTLQQLGVGPKSGFSIEGYDELWSDFTTDVILNSVKTYVCDKVRLIFDTPNNSFLVTAIQERTKEFEWRLNVAAERTGSYE